MIRKTLVVTAAAAAAALAFAPLAQADTGPHDVTDRFVAMDSPDAFGAKGDLHLIVSEYGASGLIECTTNDADALTSCVQFDAWGDQHPMQHMSNIGPREVWVTVPGGLPPVSEIGGSFALDFVTSLGAIGVGVGTGSGSGAGSS